MIVFPLLTLKNYVIQIKRHKHKQSNLVTNNNVSQEGGGLFSGIMSKVLKCLVSFQLLPEHLKNIWC